MVKLDLVDLDCLANFWWSEAKNGESGAVESLCQTGPISHAFRDGRGDEKSGGDALFVVGYL